jgi:hypothetical protein
MEQSDSKTSNLMLELIKETKLIFYA